MSGYDKKIKRNTSLNLMAGRLDIYDGTQERPDDSEKENTTSNLDGFSISTLAFSSSATALTLTFFVS